MPNNAASQPTSVQSQYEAQVAADLERNTKDQERLRAEIASLQEQLDTLERDHTLLLGVQHVFTTGGRGSKVPTARRGERAPKSPPMVSGSSAKQPSLAQFVGTLLAAHDGPRSAAEIAAELAEHHPQRNSNVNVVRNALELLVSKSQAHRSKQGKSVFYSRTATGE